LPTGELIAGSSTVKNDSNGYEILLDEPARRSPQFWIKIGLMIPRSLARAARSKKCRPGRLF
jgi:hypothetical protein